MKATIRPTIPVLVLVLTACFFGSGSQLSAGECPELVATMSGWMYTPRIAVSDNFTYVIEGGGRLTIFDSTRPTDPVVTWSGHVCNPYYDEGVYGFEIAQGIAFGLFGQYPTPSGPRPQKLCVIDVSSPAAPVSLGEDGFDLNDSHIRSLAVSGGYSYLAGYPFTNNMYVELRVFDVILPSSPVLVGSYHFHPGPDVPDDLTVDVSVSGGYAYVVAGFRLKVIDVTVPSSPVEVGSLDLTDAGERLAVSGRHAYVAGPSGLRVIDVSSPSAPVEVGFVTTEGYVTGMAVASGFVYVSVLDGLRVIDVRVPSSPVEVGSAGLAWAWDVAASGRYADVVAEEELSVFDSWGCKRPWQHPMMPLAVE